MKKKTAVPEPPTAVSHMVEEVVGCKWSVTVLALVTSGVNRPGAVLALVTSGVNRPGAMQRRVRGLTGKVLNERLKKLLRFGIIERQMFAEVPPRVEYRLTTFGRRFNSVIAHIAALEDDRGTG